MTTLDIVKDNLNFLVEEYDFLFEFNCSNGNHFIFKNKNGYVDFYEWKQFDEFEIFIKCGLFSKRINLIAEYPEKIGRFNQSHKGLKWLFLDDRNDFWKMISEIIKNEIEKTNSIFGLSL